MFKYIFHFLIFVLPLCWGQVINRAPFFLTNGDMARYSLREDTLVGTAIYTLKGSDPESSNVTYSISGDYFSVDKWTGVVTLIKPLDREKEDKIEVIISITDSSQDGEEPNTISLRREIQVLDVNDNYPVFENGPYAFSVPETATVGTKVYDNIVVQDEDIGQNSEISFECAIDSTPQACETFNIQPVLLSSGKLRGVITLIQPLDYEKIPTYTLRLKAIDNGIQGRLTSYTNIVIEVIDVQDQPPAFINSPYSVVLAENSPANTKVLLIKAQDQDTGNPYKLELFIRNEPKGYFKLGNIVSADDNVVTAQLLTTEVAIDREDSLILEKGGLYVFQIEAKEIVPEGKSSASGVANVTVIVKDVDDHIPEFNLESVSVSVPENIGSGVALPSLDFIVSDEDIGENASFELSLQTLEGGEGAFAVYPEKAYGRTPVIIKVLNSSLLDYERPEYQKFKLLIVASNKSSPLSSATVSITLTDFNDNSPIFNQSTYRFLVPENIPPGTQIAQVTATDVDTGKLGQIKYALKGFGSQKFTVNELTGNIYLSDCGLEACLDYEAQKNYPLTFFAEDGGGKQSTCNIIFDVKDINDNRPKFEERQYRRTLQEGELEFEPPLVIKASDIDGPEQGGGKILYKIAAGNSADDLFVIDESFGAITLNRAINRNDVEASRYKLVIEATDYGLPPLSSNISVLISIGIEDNERPIFITGPYIAYVKENALPGTVVVKINANDPDGPDEQLHYQISSGSKDNFLIDESLGTISVSPGAILDADTDSRISLTVYGIDSGKPHPQTGTTTVEIIVEDINNKPPKFEKKNYIQYVSETVDIGEIILKISATDPDTTSELLYSLSKPFNGRDKAGVELPDSTMQDFSNAISINDKTGDIKVEELLKFEVISVLTFTVNVLDVNAEINKPQNDSCEVVLYIQKYNDENPIFASPWSVAQPRIELKIPEETPAGSVIFTLNAKDPKTGESVTHFEKIDDSDPENYFVVNLVTGVVTLNKKFDYELLSEKVLKFDVLAVHATHKSVANVFVEVIDINDNSPIFLEDQYQIEIPESTLFPEIIMIANASDKDTTKGYGNVKFYLSGEGSDMFIMDEETGSLQVAPNKFLDREVTSYYNLKITAKDSPTDNVEQRRAYLPISVKLLDINDNAPRFIKDQYTAVVPENAAVGSSVVHIQALDSDLEANAELDYSLLQGTDEEAHGFFRIDNTSGIVTVKQSLSGKGRSYPYVLKARATDHGDFPLFTDTELYIYIGDVLTNDGIPSFIQPSPGEIAYVSENTSIGGSVYQVLAIDPDDINSDNGKLRYYFLEDNSSDNVTNTFVIDPVTGLISTKSVLDRETKAKYNVILVVQDLGKPPQQASRSLTIIVNDVDDNPPQFPAYLRNSNIQFNLKEESGLKVVIGTITAKDDDLTDNGKIDYAIIGGNENKFFAINRTDENKGVIYTLKSVDREQNDKFTLIIKCFKAGINPPKVTNNFDTTDLSQIQVIVKIVDIDDHLPIFQSTNYTFGIRQNSLLHTEIGVVEATDLDSDSYSMTYEITKLVFFDYSTSMKDPFDYVFTIDENSGLLSLNESLVTFPAGYFEISVRAKNSPIEERFTETSVKIYLLREMDLMKFVFRRPPREVRESMPEFLKSLSRVIPQTSYILIADSQYYSNKDGSLDIGSTSSCFQISSPTGNLGPREIMEQLDPDRHKKISNVFKSFEMAKLERCVAKLEEYKWDWIEIWILSISAFILIATLIAIFGLCCCQRIYKRHMKHLAYERLKHLQENNTPSNNLVTPPPMVVPAGSLIVTPSVYGSEMPNLYEWQERVPMDATSFHSYAA